VVSLLELSIALILVIAILIGMVDLVRYVEIIYRTPPIETYDILLKFLGHALLLVVGAELIQMLVQHTPGSIIEVLLYAIARKILVGSDNITDYVLGIVSIAGIFAINKFLIQGNNKHSEDS